MFKLAARHLHEYKRLTPDWGPIGEITFLRTYSRVKADGTKETWLDVCERVVNWTLQTVEKHLKDNKLPVNHGALEATALIMLDGMFHFRWTPPGRGLWAAGTPALRSGSGALQNCCFVSTDVWPNGRPGDPFEFLASALMLGVGVGADNSITTLNLDINIPNGDSVDYVVPDTREGWAESIGELINTHLEPGHRPLKFDYSQVRPAGQPIKGFGGIASGPGPLIECHNKIREILTERGGCKVDTVVVADLVNLIGRCIVSGNIRRSAEIFLANADDLAIRDLKNPEVFPDRQEWSWLSNNSIIATDSTEFDDSLVERIVNNGEPGVVFINNFRNYGRSEDNDVIDYRIRGVNPCAEIGLEPYEMCTLAETYISRCRDYQEFASAISAAHLFAKAVTLVPTQWGHTNSVMQRNRRLGVGVSGIAEFYDTHGEDVLIEWLDHGYAFVVHQDSDLSETLAVRESIKLTCVKPSGSISLLAGVTPGVHWTPGSDYYLRAVRFAESDPTLKAVEEAGYKTEPDLYSPKTRVAYFPVQSTSRAEHEVPAWEKYNLAALAQMYWADNGVSLTVSFDPERERKEIQPILEAARDGLKGLSFLPLQQTAYKQAPYTAITREEYEEATRNLKAIDLDLVYLNGTDATQERGCDTEACEIKSTSKQQTG